MSELKHFEDLWNKCEKASLELGEESISSILEKLSHEVKQLQGHPEEVSSSFGCLLFYLCQLAQKSNTNAFVALKNALEQFTKSTTSA